MNQFIGWFASIVFIVVCDAKFDQLIYVTLITW